MYEEKSSSAKMRQIVLESVFNRSLDPDPGRKKLLHKNLKIKKFPFFDLLHVLYGGQEGSSVVWKSFMEAKNKYILQFFINKIRFF